MAVYGGETVRFFEIYQPLCTHTYGVAPCTAVLGSDGAEKCRNTRFTCQDSANYDPGTLVLRFAMDQDGLLQHRDKYGVVIPSMLDLSTTPGAINLAGMDRSMSALGQREAVSVELQDHLHSDHQVDKYRLQRKSGAASIPVVAYEPYTRGTFWGKWKARNPYWPSYACIVREGYLGQELADMRVRHYILDKVDGPVDGVVKITAKDLFSVIEARKAVAPVPSQGELLADISAVAGTATLSPAGIGNEEYPASGYVRIGDESIAFTRVADALTLTTRGALGSTADEHKAEDLVQLVLVYTTELAVDIIYDLATTYSEIPAASIPKTTWDLLAAGLTELYTAYITEPTPVSDLIGELEEQAGLTVWPDVSTGEMPLAVLQPSAASVTVDDDEWIIEGSFSHRRQDEKRVSRVLVYYGQINPNEALDEERNYHSRFITPDLDAEGPQQYGTALLRKVFSRWIPQFGRQLAADVGERILAIYRDPPIEAQFAIPPSRDGELEIARSFTLQVAEIQDASGSVLDVAMVPVKLERGLDQIAVTAQQVTFTGGGGLGGNDRTIYIENDSLNLNLRTIHDSLFAVPTGVETVTFIVVSGFTVGSAFTSTSALKTGDWPSGVVLNLTTAGGRIQGKGGGGGDGGDIVFQNGSAGTSGGDALEATYPINIDNLDGEIFAGGGGSGGGGLGITSGTFGETLGGGGGGAGAGTLPGALGLGGTNAGFAGSNSGAATRDAGGTGGVGGGAGAGNGVDGGGPGLDGSAGQGGNLGTSGGSAGTKGRYIVGNTFVTWINNGDRRGGVA
jgi:hypothetical protein